MLEKLLEKLSNYKFYGYAFARFGMMLLLIGVFILFSTLPVPPAQTITEVGVTLVLIGSILLIIGLIFLRECRRECAMENASSFA